MRENKPAIITIRNLLQESLFTIPDYQRPYKWTTKNVNQLIDDVLLHRDKSAYRLGTIVVHRTVVVHRDDDVNELNIVDGQQRCITILLIAMALIESLPENIYEELEKHSYKLPKVTLLENVEFLNPISQRNIYQNYREIKRRIVDFDFNAVRFFLDKCEVIKVVISDISEAFQFFDSQNARGKDLEPHDLLKAFHLRELTESISEEEKVSLIEQWEKLAASEDELKILFAQVLFRVRNWARGESARFFTKADINVFKGISLEGSKSFPYAESHKISHYFVDDYNASFQQKIDKQRATYPFQLNQVLFNGKRFFEFVNYYWNVKEELLNSLKSDSKAKEIIDILDNYEQRDRTGDKYVRNLFDCALLFYWDKFGNFEIGRVAEKLFIWSYRLRLTQKSVQLASVDNYALSTPHMFTLIHQDLEPTEVLNVSVDIIVKSQVKQDQLREIIKLVSKLNYYEQ